MRLSILVFLFAASVSLVGAQDLDLGIPGLEEESAPKPAASSSTAPGSVSSGSVNLLDMIKAGGWSMWVLGTFSLGVIGLLVYNLIDLQKRNFFPPALTNSLRGDMEAANLKAAIGKVQGADSCVSSMLKAGYAHIGEFGFDTIRSEEIREEMKAAAMKFNRGRVRTINYFSVLAQAAPMMGLLGTVSGMIGAFAKLSQGGTGDPSKFAGNISEALITTASGLVIALPAIFCYFIFRDRLQSLVSESDEHVKELLATLRRSVESYHQHEQS